MTGFLDPLENACSRSKNTGGHIRHKHMKHLCSWKLTLFTVIMLSVSIEFFGKCNRSQFEFSLKVIYKISIQQPCQHLRLSQGVLYLSTGLTFQYSTVTKLRFLTKQVQGTYFENGFRKSSIKLTIGSVIGSVNSSRFYKPELPNSYLTFLFIYFGLV